jgi:hypothetical protein
MMYDNDWILKILGLIPFVDVIERLRTSFVIKIQAGTVAIY